MRLWSMKQWCPMVAATTTVAVTLKVCSWKYVGVIECTFKTRLHTHGFTFRIPKWHSATLAGYISWLEDGKLSYNIAWKLLEQSTPYIKGSKQSAKFTGHDLNALFNSESEIFSKWHKKNNNNYGNMVFPICGQLNRKKTYRNIHKLVHFGHRWNCSVGDNSLSEGACFHSDFLCHLTD